MFELMPFDRKRENALINRFFEDFDKSFSNSMAGFKTDVKDTGDSYVIESELPGFEKEDIAIDIKGDVLTVSAQHTAENKEEKDHYVHRERSWGSFSRSFDITGVDKENIKAAYKNGVLELNLPKVSALPENNKKIAIE